MQCPTFVGAYALFNPRDAPATLAIRNRPWQAARQSARVVRMMSGVNGGIDYDIDLSLLPVKLREKVEYIQGGPDSPVALIEAAEEIAKYGEKPVLPVLVDILGFNNPIAADIAVNSLVQGGADSIPFLLKGVAAFNYAVNAYALRALGRIGDPSVAEVCVQCAITAPIPNVRRAALKALGSLRHLSQEDASAALDTMTGVLEDQDWSVRYAAITAIEILFTKEGGSGLADAAKTLALERVKCARADEDHAVKGRAGLALSAMGQQGISGE